MVGRRASSRGGAVGRGAESRASFVSRLAAALRITASRISLASPFHEHTSRPLDYIPMSIFVPFCFLTIGIYPYLWLLGSARSFAALCGSDRLGRRAAAAAALGLVVQTAIALSIAAFVTAWCLGSDSAEAFRAAIFWSFAVHLAICFPMKCMALFELRARLRGAAALWDERGMMVRRTVRSPFALVIFGTAYLQHHINRLIGLGMPGLSDWDGYRDVSLIGAISGYVIREGRDA